MTNGAQKFLKDMFFCFTVAIRIFYYYVISLMPWLICHKILVKLLCLYPKPLKTQVKTQNKNVRRFLFYVSIIAFWGSFNWK